MIGVVARREQSEIFSSHACSMMSLVADDASVLRGICTSEDGYA